LGLHCAINKAEFPEPANKVESQDGQSDATIRQEREPDKSKNSECNEKHHLHYDAPKRIARVFGKHVFITEEDARVFAKERGT
jgi:hypothetical protein